MLEIAPLSACSVGDVTEPLVVPGEAVGATVDALEEVVASEGLFVEEVLVSTSAVSDLGFIHANGLKPPEEVVDEAAAAASVDTPSSAAPVMDASLLL